jgi:N-acetylglutamate synthase-like GNAT family acetyltransferase
MEILDERPSIEFGENSFRSKEFVLAEDGSSIEGFVRIRRNKVDDASWFELTSMHLENLDSVTVNELMEKVVSQLEDMGVSRLYAFDDEPYFYRDNNFTEVAEDNTTSTLQARKAEKAENLSYDPEELDVFRLVIEEYTGTSQQRETDIEGEAEAQGYGDDTEVTTKYST